MNFRSLYPILLLILFALALFAVPPSARAGSSVSVSFSAWEADHHNGHRSEYRQVQRGDRHERIARHEERRWGQKVRYQRERHSRRAYRQSIWNPWARIFFGPAPFLYNERPHRPHRHHRGHQRCR